MRVRIRDLRATCMGETITVDSQSFIRDLTLCGGRGAYAHCPIITLTSLPGVTHSGNEQALLTKIHVIIKYAYSRTKTKKSQGGRGEEGRHATYLDPGRHDTTGFTIHASVVNRVDVW